MPGRSVWLIRAALAHLVLGFTVGAVLLVHKAVPLAAGLWALRPLHVELLLFGFVVQLAFGVALWILPRRAAPRDEHRSRWVAGALLNAGVWLVGLGGALGLGALVLAGRLAEAGAVAAFAGEVWPRVRGVRGRHDGEDHGRAAPA